MEMRNVRRFGNDFVMREFKLDKWGYLKTIPKILNS
jgi:hypothetical protein